jgi:hypothetical protein
MHVVHLNVGAHSVYVNDEECAKLGDFEVACQLDEGFEEVVPPSMSYQSIAPEMLEQLPVGPPADVWGLGTVAFLVCAQQPAFALAGGGSSGEFDLAAAT